MQRLRDEFRFHLENSFEYQGVAIWMVGPQNRDGKIDVLSGLEFRTQNLGEVRPAPPIVLSDDQAADLMDQLWRAGVRPREVGSPGHLAATQAHLKDMRKLVSKTLEVDL